MSVTSSRPLSSAVIHSVHFYDQDDALIQRMRGIVTSAISTGNSVLIVATEEHRSQLAEQLEKSGLNPEGLEKDGRLTLENAPELLTTFMVDGLPDRKRFSQRLGRLLSAARKASWNAERGLTVFGEMVALLWREGNLKGALQLEALWNELLIDEAFHLHCAYPRHILDKNGNAILLRAICDEHSHVIGAA